MGSVYITNNTQYSILYVYNSTTSSCITGEIPFPNNTRNLSPGARSPAIPTGSNNTVVYFWTSPPRPATGVTTNNASLLFNNNGQRIKSRSDGTFKVFGTGPNFYLFNMTLRLTNDFGNQIWYEVERTCGDPGRIPGIPYHMLGGCNSCGKQCGGDCGEKCRDYSCQGSCHSNKSCSETCYRSHSSRSSSTESNSSCDSSNDSSDESDSSAETTSSSSPSCSPKPRKKHHKKSTSCGSSDKGCDKECSFRESIPKSLQNRSTENICTKLDPPNTVVWIWTNSNPQVGAQANAWFTIGPNGTALSMGSSNGVKLSHRGNSWVVSRDTPPTPPTPPPIPPPIPPPKSNSIPWWVWLLVAIFVILLILLILYFVFRKTPKRELTAQQKQVFKQQVNQLKQQQLAQRQQQVAVWEQQPHTTQQLRQEIDQLKHQQAQQVRLLEQQQHEQLRQELQQLRAQGVGSGGVGGVGVGGGVRGGVGVSGVRPAGQGTTTMAAPVVLAAPLIAPVAAPVTAPVATPVAGGAGNLIEAQPVAGGMASGGMVAGNRGVADCPPCIQARAQGFNQPQTNQVAPPIATPVASAFPVRPRPVTAPGQGVQGGPNMRPGFPTNRPGMMSQPAAQPAVQPAGRFGGIQQPAANPNLNPATSYATNTFPANRANQLNPFRRPTDSTYVPPSRAVGSTPENPIGLSTGAQTGPALRSPPRQVPVYDRPGNSLPTVGSGSSSSNFSGTPSSDLSSSSNYSYRLPITRMGN